jgi:hypothetical protein
MTTSTITYSLSRTASPVKSVAWFTHGFDQAARGQAGVTLARRYER